MNIPLEVVPLTRAYWDRVASKTIAEIKAGRTPNPDILCNSQIKFGAFIEFLERQKISFDRIASGHYARIERTADSNKNDKVTVDLQMSADRLKDQTYFLAQLNQRQLSRCMFPLGVRPIRFDSERTLCAAGSLTKKEVRELAHVAKLPTCRRKDSQGICFLGKVRFSAFVQRHLG